MSYNKRVWKSGDRITKEALNNMENGIEAAHQNSGGTGSVAIVDNLNSDSSTSALSAKQGKELNNKMPAKSIVEGGKIYLAKEDGTKLDSGTELPAGGSTIEVVKELGILGQDIISSQNIVVDFLVNAEDAFKRNSFLECNYNNYVNILAGALKQAIQKIEELERKISEKKEG